MHDFISLLPKNFYCILALFIFRLNYLISGLQPCSFHFVNIILHGIVSTLILKVVSVVLSKILEDESPKAALLSALLFAVHPIHTESVSTRIILDHLNGSITVSYGY